MLLCFLGLVAFEVISRGLKRFYIEMKFCFRDYSYALNSLTFSLH